MLFVFLQACGSTKNESHEEHGTHESEHTEEAEGDHSGHDHDPGSLMAVREELSTNQVLITARQMENVDVGLDRPSRENLSDVVKVFGHVVLPPEAEASVTPFIGGVVRDIRVVEGDEVRKGEVIARIEHPDVADLQQAYLEAVNQNKYLDSEFSRQKRLLRDSVNAARTVQKLESDYHNNLARLQTLREKLRMINIDPGEVSPDKVVSHYPLKAPITGIVASVFVNTGVHVTEQKELFHIADNEQVHLDLDVYEKDLPKIQPGQRLTFNLTNNPLPAPMDGEVLKKSTRFDAESRTALVHADVTGEKKSLLPGMGVTARIQSGESRVWTLPSSAIVSDGGKDYVFRLVREGDEHEEEHAGHDHEKGEAGHDHENGEAGHEHEDPGHDRHPENGGYYIFERVEVDTGSSRGHLTEVTFPDAEFQEARFATGNAQAILSEMKSGSAGHHGHAH
ncbi:MAG: efflux RND transporter periplasmic adaptor subunit [Marinilabiliaceae bacterium]